MLNYWPTLAVIKAFFIDFAYTNITVNWSGEGVEGINEQIIDYIVHGLAKLIRFQAIWALSWKESWSIICSFINYTLTEHEATVRVVHSENIDALGRSPWQQLLHMTAYDLRLAVVLYKWKTFNIVACCALSAVWWGGCYKGMAAVKEPMGDV